MMFNFYRAAAAAEDLCLESTEDFHWITHICFPILPLFTGQLPVQGFAFVLCKILFESRQTCVLEVWRLCQEMHAWEEPFIFQSL